MCYIGILLWHLKHVLIAGRRGLTNRRVANTSCVRNVSGSSFRTGSRSPVVEGVTANHAVLVRRPVPKRQIEDLGFPSFSQRALGLSPEPQSRLTHFHTRIMNEILYCPNMGRGARACPGLGRPALRERRPYIRIGTPPEILVEDR
jgi:hypothetical protein